MKVYFCGMIGSGKTTIGKPLASIMRLPFFDLADRPRVNASTTLEEDIRLMWETHASTYFEAGDIHYDTSRLDVDQEVEALRGLIQQWYRDHPQ